VEGLRLFHNDGFTDPELRAMFKLTSALVNVALYDKNSYKEVSTQTVSGGQNDRADHRYHERMRVYESIERCKPVWSYRVRAWISHFRFVLPAKAVLQCNGRPADRPPQQMKEIA
jgi:hypothetical protein